MKHLINESKVKRDGMKAAPQTSKPDIKPTPRDITDRKKIETLCLLTGAKMRRLGKSTVIANRRFYFNDKDEIEKIIDYADRIKDIDYEGC